MPWRFVVTNAVVLLLATGIAVSTLWPVYQSPAFIVTASVAALAGIAIATAGFRYSWSGLTVMLVTIGVYLVIGVPLAVPSETQFLVLPTPEGFLDLLAGTALSWKQLLTIVTPVGSYQALLVPVLVLVLVSTTVAMSTALRSVRGELAVIPPFLLFVAAILLGPTRAQAPVETALCLAIVLVLWAMWVHRRRRNAAIARVTERGPAMRESAAQRRLTATRTILSAAVVMALAVAGGTLATVAYPAESERDVLRRHVEQPFDPRDYPSPLSAFRSYLQPEQASRSLLTVSSVPSGALIRIAALDTYDGIVYSVVSDQVASASGSFTRVPYRIDQSEVDGQSVAIDVLIDGYRGVWVPGVGKLSSMRFTGDDGTRLTDAFFYNDNSATGAVLGGLTAGDSYHSEAVIPRPIDTIASLRPGTAVLPPIGVEPDGLEAALASWVDSADDPGQQLADMLAGLQRDGYVSHGIGPSEPTSRSGHAADRIAQLMTEQPMLGDGEQYSVAAAIMARMIGFPARVVVGFEPQVTSSTGPITVTGEDIAAWIEVQDSSGAWIGLNPNPEPRAVPEKQPDQPNVVSRPQVVLPPPPDEPQDNATPPDPQRAPTDDKPPLDPFLVGLLAVLQVVGWTLLGLALVLSPFLAVIAAKFRRRLLRRRAEAPVERIAGGWREFTDLAVDHGFPVTASDTRAEGAAAVGGVRSLVLAGEVDRAVFAPGVPDAADADRIWSEVDGLQEELATGLTRWQRLRALVSVRSFRQYRSQDRDRRDGGDAS